LRRILRSSISTPLCKFRPSVSSASIATLRVFCGGGGQVSAPRCAATEAACLTGCLRCSPSQLPHWPKRADSSKISLTFPDSVVGNGRDDGKRTVIRVSNADLVTIGGCFSGPVMHHNASLRGGSVFPLIITQSRESGAVRAKGGSLAARCARLFSQKTAYHQLSSPSYSQIRATRYRRKVGHVRLPTGG
jgi:hypothetical protein